MKSVGEAMAIGRTFQEAFQKALRSLEIGRFGWGCDAKEAAEPEPDDAALRRGLAVPGPERVFLLRRAMRRGWTDASLSRITGIDPWFLAEMRGLLDAEADLHRHATLAEVPDDALKSAKRRGFSDHQLGRLWNVPEKEVRADRLRRGIRPVYKLVDTCAAEFEAATPYYYSTYEEEDELRPAAKPRIVILGGGPNRIGQGIEFDYCCVQAAYALKEAGYETVMVNSNPETVSTDYDTSDVLFFEPLTAEHVLDLCERVGPKGVIVQLGGQTPLNLSPALEAAKVPIIGTSPESIDIAGDRGRFKAFLDRLHLRQPANGAATGVEQAIAIAQSIGYPVLVRPSHVLGGRAMEIVYDEASLRTYWTQAVLASPGKPVLVDKFLEDAIEVDVDAVADGRRCVIGGLMEHIEEAGIHSGDSCCTLPAWSLPEKVQTELRDATRRLAEALDVKGLMNVQFAVKADRVYLIEVNPRASRTVPFVSKATGVPLARIAARVMAGETLEALGFTEEVIPPHFSVKEPVFPFSRFPGVDIVLGPEMKSTGEVMGIDHDLGAAFAKAKLAATLKLPRSGTVFLSVKDADKRSAVAIAQRLSRLGYRLLATAGTHTVLKRSNVPCTLVHKIAEGLRPNVLDVVKNREVHLIVNTPSGRGARTDEGRIRAAAVALNIPAITTMSGAAAAVRGLESVHAAEFQVRSLQEYLAFRHPPSGSPKPAAAPSPA